MVLWVTCLHAWVSCAGVSIHSFSIDLICQLWWRVCAGSLGRSWFLEIDNRKIFKKWIRFHDVIYDCRSITESPWKNGMNLMQSACSSTKPQLKLFGAVLETELKPADIPGRKALSNSLRSEYRQSDGWTRSRFRQSSPDQLSKRMKRREMWTRTHVWISQDQKLHAGTRQRQGIVARFRFILSS